MYCLSLTKKEFMLLLDLLFMVNSQLYYSVEEKNTSLRCDVGGLLYEFDSAELKFFWGAMAALVKARENQE